MVPAGTVGLAAPIEGIEAAPPRALPPPGRAADAGLVGVVEERLEDAVADEDLARGRQAFAVEADGAGARRVVGVVDSVKLRERSRCRSCP